MNVNSNADEPLLRVTDLMLSYQARRSPVTRIKRASHLDIQAIRGVSLAVIEGETLGLVGESGCGKSSLARCVAGLTQPTGGEILFRGARLGRSRRSNARKVQMVFQDPASSLNPSLTVGSVLNELLDVHRVVSRDAIDDRSRELLEMVGLSAEMLEAYPREMSGGQRQRVALARALALEPQLLVADEPTSALDVSVQAAVLNLLVELRQKLNLTMLFISHNLAVVRRLCDRVAIMYSGKIVEEGTAAEIMARPSHPYTAALLSAIPEVDPRDRRERAHHVQGEAPSALAIPEGCAFHPRCPRAQAICQSSDPLLTTGRDIDHWRACHFPLSEDTPSMPAASASK